MEHTLESCYKAVRICPLTYHEIEPLRKLRNAHRQWFVHHDEISQESQNLWYQRYLLSPQDYMFSINRIGDGRFIGGGALYNFCEDGREAEFGRFIIDRHAAEGPGFGFMATVAICELGFTQLSLQRIRLEVYKSNIAACKIYARVGFIPADCLYDSERLMEMVLTREALRKVLKGTD